MLSSVIVDNLLSAPVIAFLVAGVATLARFDIRLPDSLYPILSSYLLLAIGVKGGRALGEAELAELWRPLIAVLVLGVVTPLVAFAMFRRLGRVGQIDAAALAEPALGLPETATVLDVLRHSPQGVPGVVLYGPDARPAAVVDDSAAAAVPPALAATTPATAVAYPLAAGAYVKETDRGAELLAYLAQIEGSDYAVVDDAGTITGLLRQLTVLNVLTGKQPSGTVGPQAGVEGRN